MFGKRLLPALLLTLVLTGNANADFQGEMNKMFGSMTNVTAPTGYQDQSRGAYSGGRVTVKNKLVDFEVLGFDPPKIDSGCGGLDFYAGSFSYISADQFVALLRAIGSNAVGYSFGLALGSLCPSCKATMDKLRDAVQDLNGLASNSCKIAQAGVDALQRKTNTSLAISLEDSVVGSAARRIGAATDGFDGWLDNFNKPESLSKKLTHQEMEEITGNIAWKVMTEPAGSGGKMIDWFQFGDKELAEMAMNIVGTLVIQKPTAKAADPTAAADPKSTLFPQPYQPTLSLEDILGTGERTVTVEVWTCPGVEAAECLNPVKAEKTFETMVAKVKKILHGDIDAGGTNMGIAYKFKTNTGALDATERSFLELLPQHGKRIRDLAIYNPQGLDIYARKAAEKIALDLTSRFVSQIMSAVRFAASQNQHASISTFLANLDLVEEDLAREETRIAEGMAKDANLDQLYNGLVATGARINWVDLKMALQKAPQGAGNQSSSTVQP